MEIVAELKLTVSLSRFIEKDSKIVGCVACGRSRQKLSEIMEQLFASK